LLDAAARSKTGGGQEFLQSGHRMYWAVAVL
jgi:hypothetical protein